MQLFVAFKSLDIRNFEYTVNAFTDFVKISIHSETRQSNEIEHTLKHMLNIFIKAIILYYYFDMLQNIM